MNKNAPTIPRLLAIVLFTFSCFAVLIYMWLTFGGPVPLKPEGYRFKAVFTEAPLLVSEADVRIAGLNVGKVKEVTRAPNGGVLAEIEIEDRYAPIGSNARAILRPKSLLGQTYVELTPGTKGDPLPEGDTLDAKQVDESVEIDELLTIFDEDTRKNLQGWMRELAKAIDKGRGEDFNQALGHLPQFVASGSDVLRVLDDEEPALRRLVRNSGVTLGALNERKGQFRDLIVNADRFFDTVASRNARLSEIIEILPTFLDETRTTVARLEEFSIDTRPLVQDLQPVATDLRPTLHDVGKLAPDLEHLFRNLDPLIDEAPKNLPHAARFLRGTVPVWESLYPYLQELNPVISFLNYYQEQVSDFIMNGSGSISGQLPPLNEQSGPRHYLRQMSIINSRGFAFNSQRQDYDRGNAYPAPNYLRRANAFGIQESWDCKPTGVKPDATTGQPPCFIAPGSLWDGNRYPQLVSGVDKLVPPPEGTTGRRPARP